MMWFNPLRREHRVLQTRLTPEECAERLRPLSIPTSPGPRGGGGVVLVGLVFLVAPVAVLALTRREARSILEIVRETLEAEDRMPAET